MTRHANIKIASRTKLNITTLLCLSISRPSINAAFRMCKKIILVHVPHILTLCGPYFYFFEGMIKHISAISFLSFIWSSGNRICIIIICFINGSFIIITFSIAIWIHPCQINCLSTFTLRHNLILSNAFTF